MCGIAGFYSSRFTKEDLSKMTKALTHRGPDAEGIYLNDKVGLGHRRLSILDLSSSANQPIFSHSKRYVMVYNGEVYNYREIGEGLKIDFQTTSDTEVILEAFDRFGPDFVHRINGMFALAIFDIVSEELYIFRDRIGIKPLYYYYNNNDFAFASETKSLLQLNIDKSLNITALKDYFFMEYVPGNLSIFKNISKLEPGHFLKISSGGIQVKKYYDVLDKIQDSKVKDENEYIGQFEENLFKSVKYQSISDVPLGAFLSGGIDSSLICSVFQNQNSDPINTFTIGFDVKDFDESTYANEVARLLKTKHTLHTLTSTASKGVVPDLVKYYDEPFAAPSAIPSLIVCEKARRSITVALSGDGGDELFMGYGYYNWHKRISQLSSFGGYAGRKIISRLLQAYGNRGKRAGRIIDYKDFKKIWLHIWSQEQYMFSEKEITKLFNEPYSHTTTLASWEKIDDMPLAPFEKISLFDIKNYLPNNLLYKMDIASMASGLEVRVPYLDHNLVEFAINVPLKYKIRGHEQKYLMKKTLEKYLLKDLVYRKKWGFPAPVGEWLKSDLKYLIDLYLNEDVISKQGIFNYQYIQALVRDFMKGRDYEYKKVWSLVFFQMWYEKYIDSALC